jgi:predicted DNA-binding protein (MmcQ/YjbR family)
MPVTRAEIDAICAALPGAEEAHPPELVSWKVGGRMFACFGGDGAPDGVSVKTADMDTAAMLIEAGAAVRAPYFHRSWVRLPFETTEPEEARHRIEASHAEIVRKLPKPVREALR